MNSTTVKPIFGVCLGHQVRYIRLIFGIDLFFIYLADGSSCRNDNNKIEMWESISQSGMWTTVLKIVLSFSFSLVYLLAHDDVLLQHKIMVSQLKHRKVYPKIGVYYSRIKTMIQTKALFIIQNLFSVFNFTQNIVLDQVIPNVYSIFFFMLPISVN